MNFNEFHKELAKGNKYPSYIKIPLLTFTSWLFQSILYMDNTERSFKILLDILIFLPIFFVVNNHLNIILSIFLAIIIAHTINWVFNGQIFVLLKNLKLTNTSKESFIKYLDTFEKKVDKKKSIAAAAAFGSLSREKLNNKSDLDIRIIRNPGIINGFESCFFVMKERTLAFFNRFPLDIYILDDIQMIDKHIINEKPIPLYDPYNILININEKY